MFYEFPLAYFKLIRYSLDVEGNNFSKRITQDSQTQTQEIAA